MVGFFDFQWFIIYIIILSNYVLNCLNNQKKL